MAHQLYFSDKQISERYSTHRTTVWRWVRQGLFPKPVKLTPGCARWPLDEIEAYESEIREASKREE